MCPVFHERTTKFFFSIQSILVSYFWLKSIPNSLLNETVLRALKVNKPTCKQTHVTWWGSTPFWAQKGQNGKKRDVFHSVRHFTKSYLSVKMWTVILDSDNRISLKDIFIPWGFLLVSPSHIDVIQEAQLHLISSAFCLLCSLIWADSAHGIFLQPHILYVFYIRYMPTNYGESIGLLQ